MREVGVEPLLALKLALGAVLLWDVVLLLRHPTGDDVVTRTNPLAELRRKGLNSLLMPFAVVVLVMLDFAGDASPWLSLALLALTLAYLALPRPVALGPEGLLLDGRRTAPARLLGVEHADEGATVQVDWHGWLLERRVPAGAVAEALLAQPAKGAAESEAVEPGEAEPSGGEGGPPEAVAPGEGDDAPLAEEATTPAD